MKNRVFITILLIVALGVVMLSVIRFWSDDDVDLSQQDTANMIVTIPEPHELRETDPVIIQSKIQELKSQKEKQNRINALTGELKTYQNKEVGISFQYPDIFNRVDMRIINGETGRMFTGVLEFAPNHWISFGGATEDYTASKGGTLIGTHGYEKQGEKYAIKFVWGDQEVAPSGFWPINGGKDQAIVMRDTEIEQVLSRESIAAFVNIPNSSFPGVVFEISPSSPGQTLDEKEIEILRQIVSSITFE